MIITQTTNKNIIKSVHIMKWYQSQMKNINNLNQSNLKDNNDINMNTEIESDSEDNKPFKKN